MNVSDRTYCQQAGLRGRSLLVAMAALCCAGSGCAVYSFTFDCDKRINVSSQRESAPLNIDIVSITAKDLERNPELANFTAKQWFEYKQANGGHTLVPRNQVTSVTGLRGAEQQPYARKITPSYRNPIGSATWVYLFADFANKEGSSVLPAHQYRLAPAKARERHFTVIVGGDRLEVQEGEYLGPKEVVRR